MIYPIGFKIKALCNGKEDPYNYVIGTLMSYDITKNKYKITFTYSSGSSPRYREMTEESLQDYIEHRDWKVYVDDRYTLPDNLFKD
jgi:hypothetical protein